MVEEKDPQELEEVEDFNPPVRSKEEQPAEEKKFWYAIRQLHKEIKDVRSAVGMEGDDVFKEKKEYPEVLEDIEKRNTALLNEIDKRDRAREVRDFIRENPQFQSFQGKIEKTALHPKFFDISIDFIAKGYAFDNAEKIGAEKGKQADDEAEKTKTGGTSLKNLSSEKDYFEMSDEEFEKEVSKAKKRSG